MMRLRGAIRLMGPIGLIGLIGPIGAFITRDNQSHSAATPMPHQMVKA
jgi:hypothetical protein